MFLIYLKYMNMKKQLSSFFRKIMESLTMNNFKKLGLSNAVLKSIDEHGFESPTAIQEKSIPLILAGEDVIGGAATGSGKTLSFASGILQNSEKGKGIQALILTPTRELAEQVANSLRKFSKYDPLNIASIYGGVGINTQIKELKNAEVVVGTPGRLLDHISRNTIKLNNVKTLVLDEADHMFDMGFKVDVEKIIKECPQNRQTLLFSATITKDIVRLSRKYMENPVRVSTESYIDPQKLNQVVYKVQDDMKLSLLVYLLQNEKSNLGMVFCNTKRNTDKVAKNLRKSSINAVAIHGGLTQNERTRILEKFHSGNIGVLVCTDVAGRGLDIQGVSHVYNYDIPRESKQYIHRIGRTARAGTEGKAINILSKNDHANFMSVLKDNDVDIKEQALPALKKIVIERPDIRLPKPVNRMNNPSRKGRKPRHKNC
ncbi:ATP-dependent RNA helicase [Methanosarcina mazei Go1]|uniref:ATP-dependent RNA helicase n=1 Tax=Methanosarcina mazei (strain ATCC BAA-159 / DSM 3647 / Goe1 / Go1 / JCM 11833 / OCM 88) TaxID=192952 RepID=Q8PU01_METMA|nr:ATP-dependent RNA helicase [Methanosarcina mazei Go1]